MNTTQDELSFLCPNCGSRVSLGKIYVSPAESTHGDPWSAILQIIECALCRISIPAHLGERWNKISVEEARKEWLEIYKYDYDS